MRESYEKVYEDYLSHGFVLDSSKEEVDQTKTHKDKLDCHCEKHEVKLMIPYGNILTGRYSCPECRKENKRKILSDDEKLSALKEHNLEYVSGDLTRILNPLDVKCQNGHIFTRSLNNIMRGEDKCPFCNGELPNNYWTIERINKWLDKNMNGYTVKDMERISGELRVLVKCPNPEHEEYWTAWNHIYHDKTECRQCYYEKNNKVNWNVDNIDGILSQYGFTILDRNDFKSSHDRFAAKDELGFIYMVSIHYLVMNRTSFHWLKSNPYAIHNIRQFCKLYRPDYDLISEEYTGYKQVYRWIYLGDGLPDGESREFDMSLDRFYSQFANHPALTKSKLELRCKQILEKYGISFKEQKKFDGCVYKKKLRFDFYFVLDGVEYCIETDGRQHEKPVPYFGGLDAYKEQVIKDRIKDEYCENNNIHLIRIPQREFKNMENIIVSTLNLELKGA